MEAEAAEDLVLDFDYFVNQLKKHWQGSTLQVKALHAFRNLRQHKMPVKAVFSALPAGQNLKNQCFRKVLPRVSTVLDVTVSQEVQVEYQMTYHSKRTTEGS